MAERKFLFMGSDGFHEEGATSDSLTLGGLTMGGNIDMDNAGKIVNVLPATVDGDALIYGQEGAALAGLTVDTNDIVLSSVEISGLPASPAGDTYAASKKYVDDSVFSGDHGDLSNVTADQHHDESHTIASHSDTSGTGAELDTLTDGSNADSLHVHADAGITIAHSDTTGRTADDHHNQSHVLDGGDHTVTGLTIGDVLTATGATTFAFATPDAVEADRLEADYTAVEEVAKADPVYWETTTDDKFGKADAGTDAKRWVVGIAKAAISADAAGEIVSYGPAAGVLAAADSGDIYYLADGGGLTTTAPGSGKNVVIVGYAINETDLWVQPAFFGKRA